MNDLIIMAAMLAVFGIWLLFRRLKKRRSADDDPGGKDFTLTREQVEELNRQRAEKEIVLPSAPAEENRSVSEPSAAEPVMEKLSAPAGGREKQSEELTEADLWNQWVARTGDYRLSKDAIAAAAGHLTPEQALTAVTLNGAAAICRADRIGSIEPGKQADILIWNAEDLDYICYRLGSNLVDTVIKKGNVV